MSMQLDADIEFKIASNKQYKKPSETGTKTSKDKPQSDEVEDVEDVDTNEKIDTTENTEEELDKPLYDRFKEFAISENKFCEKDFSQKVKNIFVALTV